MIISNNPRQHLKFPFFFIRPWLAYGKWQKNPHIELVVLIRGHNTVRNRVFIWRAQGVSTCCESQHNIKAKWFCLWHNFQAGPSLYQKKMCVSAVACGGRMQEEDAPQTSLTSQPLICLCSKLLNSPLNHFSSLYMVCKMLNVTCVSFFSPNKILSLLLQERHRKHNRLFIFSSNSSPPTHPPPHQLLPWLHLFSIIPPHPSPVSSLIQKDMTKMNQP